MYVPSHGPAVGPDGKTLPHEAGTPVRPTLSRPPTRDAPSHPEVGLSQTRGSQVVTQGYLAHKKTPPPRTLQ